MKIGLIDADNIKTFPNLPLMKLSAYHKALGHTVEWHNGFTHYDIVYKSKIFTPDYIPEDETLILADKIVCGGTGYNLTNKLPPEIEHVYPDYSLYPAFAQNAYGFLTRGCPRNCPFCIVSEKEGKKSVQVAELSEFYQDQKNIVLLDPNILAAKEHETLLQTLVASNSKIDFTQGLDVRLLTKDNMQLLNQLKIKMIHFAWDLEKYSDSIIKNLELFKENTRFNTKNITVYVLVNFNTDFEFDLYRLMTLRKLGYDPYVMVYNKFSADNKYRALQRWANFKNIWRVVPTFEEYNRKFTIQETDNEQQSLF